MFCCKSKSLVATVIVEKEKRREKMTRLLNDMENVRTTMTLNIVKGLANYGTLLEIETKTEHLVESAREFKRLANHVETRAYWDKNAKNVYTILLGIGILFFVLGGIFIFFGICDEEEYPPLGDLIQKNITDGSDPKGGLLWIECPTYWMAMGFAADIFLILGFWFRKKLVCCWCDWCSLGRCECCLKCPMACCRECGR